MSLYTVTEPCVIGQLHYATVPAQPIEVDDEGYLVAQSDFTEPVGPSFWERH